MRGTPDNIDYLVELDHNLRYGATIISSVNINHSLYACAALPVDND